MTTTIAFEFKRIPALDYDKYFIRPLSENDLALYKQANSKQDFNKLMKLEKKKLDHNGKLYQYSLIYEKYRVELNEIRNKRILNRESMNKLSTNTTYSFINSSNNKTFKKDLEQLIKIKESENFAYYNLYKKIQDEFYKITLKFKREYAAIYMETQIFDNTTIQKIGVNEEVKLLKHVDKLPDEIIRIVHSYLTFETRVTLLEHKVKETMDKELNTFAFHYIPCRIYKDYYAKMDLYPELKAHFKEFGTIFYTNQDTHRFHDTRITVSSFIQGIKQQHHLFLKYLLLLLDQHNRYAWLYEIYRLILIGKNKLTCNTYTCL